MPKLQLLGCALLVATVALAQDAAKKPPAPDAVKKTGVDPRVQRSPGQIDIKEGDLPDGICLRIKGKDIPRQEYATWLLESKGNYYLYEYIDRILMMREAEERGLIISPEEVERAYQEDWEKMVQLRFKGEESKFLEDIQRTGRSLEEYRRDKLDQMKMDLLRGELVKSERNPTDEELQKAFQEQYGNDSQLRHLRIAFFNKFDLGEDKARQRPTREEYDEADKRAKKRAEDFLAQVQAGKSFADLVKQSSDDLTAPTGPDPSANYKQRQGEIANYKPGMFEHDIDEETLALSEPNQLTKAMSGRRGYYVVQLIERKPIKFEEVRDALYKAALQRPANAGEIYELQQRLREKAEILKARPKKQ
jgi:hypothetical protein